MPVLEIYGRDIEVGDDFLRLTPEQQNAAVDEIATSLVGAVKQEFAAINQSRVDTAHEVAASEENTIRAGDVLPVTYLKKAGGQTEKAFDPNVGVAGAVKRVFTAPGDAYSGKLQVRGPDGRLTDEAISISTEMAGTFLPAGAAAGMLAPKAGAEAARLAAQNVSKAGEFGIGLTKGQAGRKLADQTFEEDALTGGRGGVAQSVLSRQRGQQREQVEAATEGMRERFGPGRTDDPFEAAELAGKAISEKAGGLKRDSQAAYGRAEALGGEITPEATKTLDASLRAVLDEAGAMEGTAIGADLPVVRRLMAQVENLSAMKNAPEGGEVVGVGWKNFERIRRQLTNATGSNANEARVLGQVKRGFDNWLEQTVDAGLASGSPEFLQELKTGRQLWSEYMRIKGNPQQIIRKMADNSADSVEIANWLYGSAKVGGRVQSAAVVREMKKLIGPEHPAMTDLRRNVMTRLFEDVRKGEQKTYGRLAGDILEFTNGRGRELAKALYDDDTIQKLNRFANVLRTLTPDSVATNPSRSGQTIMRRLSESINKVAPLIGLSVGDFTGMMAGFAVAGGSSMRSAARARAAVSEPVPSQMNRISGRPIPALGRVQAGAYLGANEDSRVAVPRLSY